MPGAFTATETVLHLLGPGPISRWRNGTSFWHDTERPELNAGQVLSVFSYSTTWDYQECHPDGDEVAIVLEGAIDFLLAEDETEIPVHVPAGSGCLVPAGVWHRVAAPVRSTVLFVTPVPARTRHRSAEVPAPPG